MPGAARPRSHTEMGSQQNPPLSCSFFLSPSIQSSLLSNLFTTPHPLYCPPNPRHRSQDRARAWSSSFQPWTHRTFTKTLQSIHCNWESSNKIQTTSYLSLLKIGQWLPTALKLLLQDPSVCSQPVLPASLLLPTRPSPLQPHETPFSSPL